MSDIIYLQADKDILDKFYVTQQIPTKTYRHEHRGNRTFLYHYFGLFYILDKNNFACTAVLSRFGFTADIFLPSLGFFFCLFFFYQSPVEPFLEIIQFLSAFQQSDGLCSLFMTQVIMLHCCNLCLCKKKKITLNPSLFFTGRKNRKFMILKTTLKKL